MNKEELIELVRLKHELSPMMVMNIRDANKDFFELCISNEKVNIYKLDWDRSRKKVKRRGYESSMKMIVFPVEIA